MRSGTSDAAPSSAHFSTSQSARPPHESSARDDDVPSRPREGRASDLTDGGDRGDAGVTTAIALHTDEFCGHDAPAAVAHLERVAGFEAKRPDRVPGFVAVEVHRAAGLGEGFVNVEAMKTRRLRLARSLEAMSLAPAAVSPSKTARVPRTPGGSSRNHRRRVANRDEARARADASSAASRGTPSREASSASLHGAASTVRRKLSPNPGRLPPGRAARGLLENPPGITRKSCLFLRLVSALLWKAVVRLLERGFASLTPRRPWLSLY